MRRPSKVSKPSLAVAIRSSGSDAAANADGEADDLRWRELDAGLKAPHDRTVRVVFGQTLRSGGEQTAMEQGGIAKDRMRTDGFNIGWDWTIEGPDGRANGRRRFRLVARLTDRDRRPLRDTSGPRAPSS